MAERGEDHLKGGEQPTKHHAFGFAVVMAACFSLGLRSQALPADNSSQTTGEKKVLVIRVDFSDLPGDPGHGLYTAPYVQQIADTRVGPFFQRSSYGLATLMFTVTPQLYRMPWAAANYAISTSLYGLYDNALAAAASDYVLNNYDKIAVLFPSLAGLPGSGFVSRGWAEIGGSRIWLNGVFVLTSVAHELGHTLGLEHANLWHVTDGNPVSDHGSRIEYGDPSDPMGSANLESDESADFNPWFKSLLHWIPDTQIQTVTTSGVYRIYRFDDPKATGTLALKVAKDSTRDYWIACRRKFTSNPSLQHGAYVIWGCHEPAQSNLLDATTPGDDPLDAALNTGTALVDSQAGLTILPIAEGGVAPYEYMDVQIAFGPPPTVTAQPQAALVAPGQSAEFAVAAVGALAPGFAWQRCASGTTTWMALRDGGNYSGSSTARLVVTGTTLSMNGDQFQCVVTNAAGGFNASQPALLTVLPFGVSTLVGQPGIAGDSDKSGRAAQFNLPSGVAVDSADTIYVADSGNHTIRKVTLAAEVSTLAGVAGEAGSNDGPNSVARFNFPTALAVDALGRIYVADRDNSVIRVIIPHGNTFTFAGVAGQPGSSDGFDARFRSPSGIVVDRAGSVYVCDTGNHTIRKMSPTAWVSTLAGLAGSAGSADGSGSSARFDSPVGIAVDQPGNLYVADQNNSTIRKITPAGEVSTLAGLARSPGSDDGFASSARFNHPAGLAVDSARNLYVADQNNSTIRKIAPDGKVTTLAGLPGINGIADGAGSEAQFTYPSGIAVDSHGTVIVADTGAGTIRLIRSTLDAVPVLHIALAGNQVVLSWPNSGKAYVLERTSSLSPGALVTPLKGGSVDSDGNCTVRCIVDGLTGFFRLRQQ